MKGTVWACLLSIVQKIIESYGGEISAAPKVNKG